MGRPASLPEGAERVAAERPTGELRRRLHLGQSLDVDRMSADYDAGVLTLTLPVREQAKARKVAVGNGAARAEIDA